jgi:tetratricopeptide (TPR) repeat protein
MSDDESPSTDPEGVLQALEAEMARAGQWLPQTPEELADTARGLFNLIQERADAGASALELELMYRQAARLGERSHLPSGFEASARARRLLGLTLNEQGRTDEAHECFAGAADVAERAGTAAAYCDGALALLHLASGSSADSASYDIAYSRFEEYVAIARRLNLGTEPDIATVAAMGLADLALRRYHAAVHSWKEGQPHHEYENALRQALQAGRSSATPEGLAVAADALFLWGVSLSQAEGEFSEIDSLWSLAGELGRSAGNAAGLTAASRALMVLGMNLRIREPESDRTRQVLTEAAELGRRSGTESGAANACDADAELKALGIARNIGDEEAVEPKGSIRRGLTKSVVSSPRRQGWLSGSTPSDVKSRWPRPTEADMQDPYRLFIRRAKESLALAGSNVPSNLTTLFQEVTGFEVPKDPGSYCGDSGTNAGAGLAAALWLVEHAPVLLQAVKASQRSGLAVDSVDLAQTIVTALARELSLPLTDKLKVIGKLMVDVGVSLATDASDWEHESLTRLVRLADDTSSLNLTGTGFELFVLPWALSVELTTVVEPLDTRIRSLKQSIPPRVRGMNITEYELNNWAYCLLLVGKWKAATPMAEVAIELARTPRALDTLGWAHYLEGNSNKALELLSESLEAHDADELTDTWALVAFHKLSVLADVGRQDAAASLLNEMVRLAPQAEWTDRARQLLAPPLEHRSRATTAFTYDVALSFAGEDRDFAAAVATQLRESGVRVFYDDFEKADLWGRNLYSYLTDIYEKKAQYCVLFVSASYVNRRWTKLEREAAQARAFSQDQEYILPVRLDSSTSVPGILPTTAYLDGHKEGVVGIVSFILRKLRRLS